MTLKLDAKVLAGYDVFRVRWWGEEERRPSIPCPHCHGLKRARVGCGGAWWYGRREKRERKRWHHDKRRVSNDDNRCYICRPESILTRNRVEVERSLVADGYRLARLEYTRVSLANGLDMIGKPTAVWVRPSGHGEKGGR